jgi:hypothetical protein
MYVTRQYFILFWQSILHSVLFVAVADHRTHLVSPDKNDGECLHPAGDLSK